MTDEWTQAYLAETGREIDNASAQLHETTNWSIGVVIAAFSAIALAPDPYPTRWTLAAVGIALILVLRFFVRSCIAYSYLHRWNRIHRAIVRIHVLENNNAHPQYIKQLQESINVYHVQWHSSIRLKSLICANLKLGYLQLFIVVVGLLLYGLCNSDWRDPGPWIIATIVVIDLLYEYCVFPSKTYLKYVALSTADP